MSVAKKLKQLKRTKKMEPVWKGPEIDGVTQSMLSRFLVDRERFRLRVVYGMTPAPRFIHRIEYGSMWHICEEFIESNKTAVWKKGEYPWDPPLRAYLEKLLGKYKTEQSQIVHWYRVCRTQFPVYLKYWGEHPDVKTRMVLLPETVFKVPYVLPSGRIVQLRGRWDSVDLINGEVYLQENKTKGDIDEDQLRRQLDFDLQTMLYLVALRHQLPKIKPRTLLKGVRYNVIKRPLSGGIDSIRQKKDETPDEFYTRLGGLIADHPQQYFMRWKVEVTKQDIERFEKQFLIPILEQLCIWYDWIKDNEDPFDYNYVGQSGGIHYRTPYGIYNALAEGGSTEYDEYLATGSELGLVRGEPLFGELEDE